MSLSDEHRKHLRTSCLTDETIQLAGLYTETDRTKVARLLRQTSYPKSRGHVIVFPVFLPGATEPETHRIKPDKPKLDKDGDPIKYDQPSNKNGGPGAIVYFPPRSRADRLRSDAPLVWTEGEKKGLLLDACGFAVVAPAGVSCWGREDSGLHPWVVEHVTIAGRDHLLAFDGDVKTNKNVETQLRKLAHALLAAGARSVRMVPLPGDDGIDDIAHARFKEALDAGGTEAEAFAAAEARVRELVAVTAPVEPLAPRQPESLAKDQPGLAGAPLPAGLLWPSLNYEARPNGEIVRIDVDDEENETIVPVMRRPVIPMRILVDPERRETIELAMMREGGWRTQAVERRILGTSRDVQVLRDFGAPIDQENARDVVKFFSAFEELNEKTLPRMRTTRQCGWVDVDGKRDFLAPQPIAGAPLTFVGDEDAVCGLGVGGSPHEHEELIRTALSECDESAVAVAAALAAPMIEIFGLADSFALHLRGDTSTGKSTMLHVATSIYARPKSYLRGFDATPFFISALAAARCDLPMVFDEVGAAARPEDLARIVYSLANGRSRGQGQRDGSMRRSQTWRTVVLTSGEHSLVPDDSGPGGLRARVLNLRVVGFGSLDKEGIDDVRARSDEHYGHFGRAWLERLRTADWSKLREVHRDSSRYLAASATGARARQAGSWAALIVAEGLARAALGLDPSKGRVEAAFGRAEMDNETRPTAEVALERVQEWFGLQRASFPNLMREVSANATAWRGGSVERGREVLGYVAGDELWVSPLALRDFLKSQGFCDRVVLPLWAEAGHVERDGSTYQVRRRVDGERRRLVVFRGASVGLGTDADRNACAA